MKQAVVPSQYLQIALDLARRIVKGELPEGSRVYGRSVMASEYNVSPETIRRGQTVILSPGPYAELYDGDVLVLVGSPAAVEAAHNLIAPKEVTNDPI